MYFRPFLRSAKMPTSTTSSPVKMSNTNPTSPLKLLSSSTSAASVSSSPAKRLRLTEKLQVRPPHSLTSISTIG